MDAIKDLAEKLTERKQDESSVTIRWAVIFGGLWAICSGLGIGWVTNAKDITMLKTQYAYVVEKFEKYQENQDAMLKLVTEIRLDQVRREAKEK